MKILVTGGTGFTGSALCFRLLEMGHKVRILDNKEGIYFKDLQDRGAKLVVGSITNKDLVGQVTEGVDFVFHLAAAFRELNVPDKLYFDVNVNGTRWVMEAARKHKVRKVVYCSTQGVHGHVKNPPGDENSPIAPADYYQQTKYEGELVVREFMQSGMKATILRPTAIYGPGDPERFYMIFRKVEKGWFPMFGNGKTYYHPVYIDNLTDAFVLSMDPEKGNGEAYIIADREYYTIEELVRRVANAMDIKVKIPRYPITPLIITGHVCEKVCKPFGITPPIFPRRADWYRQVRAFKIDKAEADLGYNPAVGIDEGLKQTAEWYHKMGMLGNT